MRPSSTWLSLLLALAFLLPVAPASFAVESAQVPLSELPWDDQIPLELRREIEKAVEDKVKPLKEEKNDKDKPFVHVFPSNYVEIRDGKPATWVTIQRCLADRMVTERYEYLFDRNAQGKYELVTETKLNAIDDSYPTRWDMPGQARTLKPFTLQHDKMKLEMTSGLYLVEFIGDKPNSVVIVGSGRLSIDPLDDYHRTFFRQTMNVDRVDTAVTEVEIEFHTDERTLLDLIGFDATVKLPEKPGAAAVDYGSAPQRLRELFDQKTSEIQGFSPRAYQTHDVPAAKGSFNVQALSSDLGTIAYSFSPTSPQEISIARAKRALTLSRQSATSQEWELVSSYSAPETRALPVDRLERRMGLRYAQPNAFTGLFDIDGDKFIATLSVDLLILSETDELSFQLGGNPQVRYVRDLDRDEDLPFQPFRNPFSSIYGFEETFNFYRIKLDRVYRPGEIARLKLSYNSPALVSKLDEGFWRISRGGLLPFYEIIGDPAFMTFIMKTPDAYEHVAFGTERRREKTNGSLYTEWGAEHSVLFPTMIVGQFYEPIRAEIDGIEIIGYATKSAAIKDLSSPQKGMRQEVEKARSAMEAYQRMFNLRYPFDNLKIVSVPRQFYAQAPTTILYMDEVFLQTTGLMASMMRGDARGLSGTTAHEAGHQWWGGLVSNVNYLHYWFVEGLAELGSALYMETVNPGSMPVSINGWRESVYLSDHICALMDDWRWPGGVPAAPLRYTKGPFVFLMLGEHFGYDKLTEYMREVLKLHSGDLITTTDLQRIAERVFGVDLEFYWDQWIRNNGIPVVAYDVSAPREEGGKWVVDYKIRQRVELEGKVIPDRYFKMVVPLRIAKPGGGYQFAKIWIDGAEKSGRLELPFRPSGAPEVDPDLRMLFKRERL